MSIAPGARIWRPTACSPGESVEAEVLGYYLHTPHETLYTVEYMTEGEKYSNTFRHVTLHVEDLFDKITLTGADALSGATPIGFVAKAE